MSVSLESLMSKKGQFIRVTTERAMKVRKGQSSIQKRSSFVARVGVEYDNISDVQEKRADGRLPEENQGLPWGQWLEYPYTITHGGKVYLRLSVAKGVNYAPKTVYIKNGTEIDRTEALACCLASESASKGDLDVFTVAIDNIVAIG